MAKAKSSTDVLKGVKKLLQEVGWVKGQSVKHNKKGEPIGFCLSGAMSHLDADYKLVNRAVDRLNDYLPEGFYDFVFFNDDKKTTKKKVLNLLNRAIKRGAK